jgi:drug/metabolite transporter (DMT)-like permease
LSRFRGRSICHRLPSVAPAGLHKGSILRCLLWLRAAIDAHAKSGAGVVTALAQATLFEALDRGRVTVVAPIVGTGVLWTVVFAAIFLGHSEPVGRRLFVVALLVVAGSTLVGATR